MRLTADGYLRPCLFSDEGIHVKPALAQGASLSEIESLIRQAGDHKPERRASLGDRPVSGTAMSMIGG
jgi:molybdenum cofactor biosynthesis enzyme MoaA